MSLEVFASGASFGAIGAFFGGSGVLFGVLGGFVGDHSGLFGPSGGWFAVLGGLFGALCTIILLPDGGTMARRLLVARTRLRSRLRIARVPRVSRGLLFADEPRLEVQ